MNPEDYNRIRRERRIVDPEYRERVNAAKRGEAYRERANEISREKRAVDLEWRERYNAKVRLRKAGKLEEINRKHKAWLLANPEKRELYNSALRKSRVCLVCGAEMMGTQGRKWCTKCRPEGNRITHRVLWHKSAKITSRRGPDWDLQKYRAMARDGHKCRCCGFKAKDAVYRKHFIVVHHIVEYTDAQDNRLENLVTLCNHCHVRGHKLNVFVWT